MLHTHDSRIVAIKYTNFCSWIQRAYRHGGGIHQLLSNAVATNKVMHILVYADEITPENVLAPVTARKVWAIYAAIKEFHTHCQNIHAWATICVVRSSTVNMLDGHLSQLLKAILHDWFTTHVLHLQGLQLHEPVGQAQPLPHKRFYAKLGLFIMDGGAHKFALSMKGDAGCRFCSRCKNVFLSKDGKQDQGEDDEPQELTTVSSFTKYLDLHLSTDREIWASWARMSSRLDAIPQNEFKLWETAAGIIFPSMPSWQTAASRTSCTQPKLFTMTGCMPCFAREC
jgi:hypothetical protein